MKLLKHPLSQFQVLLCVVNLFSYATVHHCTPLIWVVPPPIIMVRCTATATSVLAMMMMLSRPLMIHTHYMDSATTCWIISRLSSMEENVNSQRLPHISVCIQFIQFVNKVKSLSRVITYLSTHNTVKMCRWAMLYCCTTISCIKMYTHTHTHTHLLRDAPADCRVPEV